MAHLATPGLSGSGGPHTVIELAFMRIIMTAGAGQIIPVILRHRLGLQRISSLVTFAAGNREVAISQNKAGLLMLRKGKR